MYFFLSERLFQKIKYTISGMKVPYLVQSISNTATVIIILKETFDGVISPIRYSMKDFFHLFILSFIPFHPI